MDMALSEKTARVLEQVKSGLSMLYMVDYFTEEEWMTVDLCIHKGKYVFTNGPPRHILDMSDDGLQTETIGPLGSTGGHTYTEGKEIGGGGSPVPSAEGEETDAVDSFGDLSPELSSPPSSIAEPRETPDQKIISWADAVQEEEESTFELSRPMSQPPPPPPPPPPPKPIEAPKEPKGPLFTKKQLEEAKALKDEFTNAKGRKSRSNTSNAASQSLKGGSKWVAKSVRPTSRTASGRSRQDPKAISALTPVVSLANSMQSGIHPGMIVIAQAEVHKSSKPRSQVLGVKSGDEIEVIKHVSGSRYHGKNLRTGDTGQFGEDVVQPKLHQVESVSLSSSYVSPIPNPPPSEPETASVDLEGFESNNAAQWSEVAAPKRARAKPQHPVNLTSSGMSRFAALEDEMASSSFTGSEHGLSREMAADAILASQQPQDSNAQMPRSWRYRQPKTSWKEPLKPVQPRRETCAFWATPNQGCRFTSEECRDLHAHVAVPPGQEPRNIRDGKPTWGALADYLPASGETTSPFMSVDTSVIEHGSQASVYEDSRGQSPVPTSPSTPGLSKAPTTCPYWADGGCYKSDKECRFQHAFTAGGIAEKPPGQHLRPAKWRQEGAQGSKWSRWDNPSHPARNPDIQTFKPALGGHEWRLEEERRMKEGLERAEGIEEGLKEEQAITPALDRSGEVKPVEFVKTTPKLDADGWIVSSQQDLKRELGW